MEGEGNQERLFQLGLLESALLLFLKSFASEMKAGFDIREALSSPSQHEARTKLG